MNTSTLSVEVADLLDKSTHSRASEILLSNIFKILSTRYLKDCNYKFAPKTVYKYRNYFEKTANVQKDNFSDEKRGLDTEMLGIAYNKRFHSNFPLCTPSGRPVSGYWCGQDCHSLGPVLRSFWEVLEGYVWFIKYFSLFPLFSLPVFFGFPFPPFFHFLIILLHFTLYLLLFKLMNIFKFMNIFSNSWLFLNSWAFFKFMTIF